MPLVPSSDPQDEADPVRCATFPPSRRATTTISPSRVAAAGGAVRARSASRALVDPPAGLARVPSRASARSLTPPPLPSRPPPPPPAGPARFSDWCRQPPPVITAPRPVPPPAAGSGPTPAPADTTPGCSPPRTAPNTPSTSAFPPRAPPPPRAGPRITHLPAEPLGNTRHSPHPFDAFVAVGPRPASPRVRPSSSFLQPRF